MYYDVRFTNGIDGTVPYAFLESDGCCPPKVCVDFCALACTFIQTLPQGPMWDYQKRVAIDYVQGGGSIADCDVFCRDELTCTSVVMHAIYTAQRLQVILNEGVWQVYREASPYTAISTVDDWLERYGWEDCYRSHCRSRLLGLLTPYEIAGECGSVFCEPDFPDDLECAVKKGIIAALRRAQHVGVKNLAALNFVIEPLGAVLRPWTRSELDCAEAVCCKAELVICNLGDTLPRCVDETCGNPVDTSPVQAYVEATGCGYVALGTAATIWPGVLAAECIVRSMLPTCPNMLFRCCPRQEN